MDKREPTFTRAIRRYMELYGMTQEQFSELINVNKGTVSKWMSGQAARQDTVDYVAEKLGMKSWELLMYAEELPRYELPPHVRAVAFRIARLPAKKQKVFLDIISSLEALTPDAAMIAAAV